MQINIKGALIVWQSFHATANSGAVFIGTATAAVTLPASLSVSQTSYMASKLGLIKFLEILAAEETSISIRFLHPGVIDTDMADKSGIKDKLPLDKGQLSLFSTVWSTLNLDSRTPGPFHGLAGFTRRRFSCGTNGVLQLGCRRAKGRCTEGARE